MRKKVLIIEDDSRVSQFLKRGLLAEGYNVDVSTNGEDGLQRILEGSPDLIILDRMLPLMNGIDVLQETRAHGIHTPILMLSAMGQVEDKVAGLKMGADDYISKPFDFEELLARLEALSRRTVELTQEVKTLKVQDLVLNLENYQVARGERKITLTAKEIALVELLMSHPHKVFSRERIISNVWDSSLDPLTNIVDVYIKRLRNKINKDHDIQLIVTHRGLGYSLLA
jgi:DNA-binding response OmpR family regulator